MYGQHTLSKNLLIQQVSAPDTFNDAGEGNIAGVWDTRNYTEALLVVNSVNSAGSSPTLDVYPIVGGASESLKAYTAASSGFQGLRSASNAGISICFQFTTPAKPGTQIESVSLYLRQNGTITAGSDIQVQIDSDSSGAPATIDGSVDKSGVLGVSSKMDPSTISATGAWYTFTFATPVKVGNAATIHIGLVGNYTASGTNNVGVSYTTVGSGGDYESRTDTTWSDTATRNVASLISGTKFNYVLDDDGVTNKKIRAITGTQLQTLTLTRKDLGLKLRFLYDVGGSSTPAWTAGVLLILGNPRVAPVN